MTVIAIAVTVRISILNSDPGRPGISERRGLSLSTVSLFVISDEGGMLSGLMIGSRENFSGTRNELVERRQTHPDIIGVGSGN